MKKKRAHIVGVDVFPRRHSNPLQDPYFKERKPLLAVFESACAPNFARYLAGEITHAEYREIIAPALKAYGKALEPIWVKHGGMSEDQIRRKFG